MVTPISTLPPLSDSLRESGSHLNVQCWTLMFVKGVGRATQGVQVSYCWVATQMGGDLIKDYKPFSCIALDLI